MAGANWVRRAGQILVPVSLGARNAPSSRCSVSAYFVKVGAETFDRCASQGLAALDIRTRCDRAGVALGSRDVGIAALLVDSLAGVGFASVRRSPMAGTDDPARFPYISAFIERCSFLGQGMKAPFQKDDEARPAGIILDIVSHSHWLVSRRSLQASRPENRRSFYWMSAIARVRSGVIDKPQSRAVSLLAAAATAVIVVEVACAHFGAIPGWLAYLFLMGTYGFASRAAFARTDMLFHIFLSSLRIARFSRWPTEQDRRRGRFSQARSSGSRSSPRGRSRWFSARSEWDVFVDDVAIR